MEGISTAEIKITTKSSEAQKYFNQGLSLLHSFWDFEAFRAFRRASELDCLAAMPYLGVYLSFRRQSQFSELRKKFLKRARELSFKSSAREKKYIEAFSAFERGEVDNFVAMMEQLISSDPLDLEAQVWLARLSMNGYDHHSQARGKQLFAERILLRVLKTNPNNLAAHHYWIHSVELSSTPERGLKSALRIARLAPASGHIQHMPGHIFFLLGDYQKSLDHFEKADEVDRNYLKSQKIPASNNWNYVHNLDYALAASLESGRLIRAKSFASRASQLSAVPEETYYPFAFWPIQYFAKTALGRFYLRLGEWEKSENVFRSIEQGQGSAQGYYRLLEMFSRGMRLISKSQDKQAQQLIRELEEKFWEYRNQKPLAGEEKFFKTAKNVIQIAIYELQAWYFGLKGELAKSAQWFEQAIEKERGLGYREPPAYPRLLEESQGDYFRAQGKLELAKKAYQKALKKRAKSQLIQKKLQQLSKT